MKTALLIHSCAAGSAALNRHWSYLKRGGMDMCGVGRTDKACLWPEPIITKDIGTDSYIDGANLPQRLVDTLKWFVDDRRFEEYSHVMIVEYDSIMFRPPPTDTEIMVASHHACDGQPAFKSATAWHNPWWLSGYMAALFALEGQKLIDRGDVEHGTPDYFFGLIAQELHQEVYDIPGIYSRNSLDFPEHRTQCRDLIRSNSLWFVHGVKTEAQLKEILE